MLNEAENTVDHCLLCQTSKYNNAFLCENTNNCPSNFDDSNKECEVCPATTVYLGAGKCSLCSDSVLTTP